MSEITTPLGFEHDFEAAEKALKTPKSVESKSNTSIEFTGRKQFENTGLKVRLKDRLNMQSHLVDPSSIEELFFG